MPFIATPFHPGFHFLSLLLLLFHDVFIVVVVVFVDIDVDHSVVAHDIVSD